MKVRVSELLPIISPMGSVANVAGMPPVIDLSNWQNEMGFFNLFS